MSSALPPIDQSLLPADVRNGSKDDKSRYETGLQFERQLVEQLTQQLSDTTQADQNGGSGDDGSGEGSSAATTSYKQMLPGVLADSIMQAGGLGLARTIAQNLKEGGK
jgi:Rod binding domain-containing protein